MRNKSKGRSPASMATVRLSLRQDLIDRLMGRSPASMGRGDIQIDGSYRNAVPAYSLTTMINAAIELALRTPETLIDIAKDAKDVKAYGHNE